MKRSTRSSFIALTLASALVVAACGGDDDDGGAASADESSEVSESADESSEVAASTEDSGDESSEMSESSASDDEAAAADFDLSDVCPSPIVIQTDWFPEAEHGALYQMIGDDYEVDTENQVTSGTLVGPDMVDTGVEIEVRAGGPAIGFAAPRAQIYTDDSITIAYSNLDAQIVAWADAPLVAVMAPLEINPQIIMWDADTYPDIDTIAQLGEEEVTINVFAGGGFMDVFVAEGIWSAEQVDPSYDGSPARFIAEGDIAQQGFASAEPYNYENVFEEYGKAPSYQLLHDAGFETYSQTLAVRPGDLEELSPCLEKFIPVVQHAVVDFAADPARANAMIVDIVGQVDSFWVYSDGLGEYAVETMNELGLHGNGPDDTVGNLDLERVEALLTQIRDSGLDVPEDLTAEELYTNEFIDENIGF